MYTADVVIGLVLTTAGFFALRGSSCTFNDLLSHDGTALYGSFLGASTALLGFAIASVSIIAGLISGEPFFDLRHDEHYGDFWAAFAWSIRFLGIASLISLVAIFSGRFRILQFPTLFVVLLFLLTCGSSLLRSGINLELVLKATRNAQAKRETSTARQSSG